MLAVVVTVLMNLVAAPGTFAESVPCSEGSAICSSAHSMSSIANNVYCCLDGFSMSWTGSIINGISHSSCVCYRQYYESDCVQGVEACENATSRASTDQCCLNGESMQVLSGVIINGTRTNSCKCRRYIAYATINGVFREMTPEEKAQFDAAMAQLDAGLNAGMAQLNAGLNAGMSRLNTGLNSWSQNFNHQMNQFSHNLNNGMNQLSYGLAHMFDRRGRRLSGSFPFFRR